MIHILRELLRIVFGTFVFTKYMTFKKFFNLVFVLIHFVFKSSKVRGYPVKLIVDPTNICDLRCPLCPSGMRDKSRVSGFMEFSDIKRILDELHEYVFQVDFYNWGEPLLNKDIFKMIEYAHKKNIRTKISSNLNMLSDEDALRMIESGLDELLVTVDGITADTYGKYMVGGNFTKLMHNLNFIIIKKREMKSRTPKIFLRFLIFKHNEHQIGDARRVARELGVKLRLTPTRVDMGREIFMSDEQKLGYSDWFPSDKHSRYNGSGRRKLRFRTCVFLWIQTVVNWDGSVSPCCGIYPQEYDFGNAFDEGVLAVWNNEKYRKARSVVKHRIYDSEVVCSNCVKYGFLEP